MSTDQEIFEAQEVLDEHERAQAAGVSRYSTDAQLAEAGWDHYPPTLHQVERARKILGNRE